MPFISRHGSEVGAGGGIDVSVVLPVRDGAAHVGEQVSAVRAQVLDEPAELVVVDDASTDGTADVVARAGQGPGLPVRLVRGAGVGSYAARQVGTEAATGSRLVFCDADDRVAPGWLAAHAAALRTAALSTGPLDLGGLNGPAAVAGRDWTADRRPHDGGFRPYALGANLGVRRDALERAGGWPVERRHGGDKVVCWRVQAAGHPLVWVPEARVHVRLRGGLASTLRRQHRIGVAAPSLHALFAAEGMGRDPAASVLRDWVWLGVEGVRLLAAPAGTAREARRLRWARVAGRRSGRLRGSLVDRRLYL